MSPQVVLTEVDLKRLKAEVRRLKIFRGLDLATQHLEQKKAQVLQWSRELAEVELAIETLTMAFRQTHGMEVVAMWISLEIHNLQDEAGRLKGKIKKVEGEISDSKNEIARRNCILRWTDS